MKNRHGNEYHFVEVKDGVYTIKGDLNYWRFGGLEGQEYLDYNNLGFVDPSGGPFIEAGYFKINDRLVKKIKVVGEDIHFEVE